MLYAFVNTLVLYRIRLQKGIIRTAPDTLNFLKSHENMLTSFDIILIGPGIALTAAFI